MTGVGVEYQCWAICGNGYASLSSIRIWFFDGETSWEICDNYNSNISQRGGSQNMSWL
jgi:hypothetical protein